LISFTAFAIGMASAATIFGATLPGQVGSAEFMDAYRRALAGEVAPIFETPLRASKPGSVSAAVAAYLDSIDFGGLALATQRDRRAILDRFREAYGEKSFAGLERKHVDFWITGKATAPHAAKSFLKALRAVVKIAMRIGLRADDPTAGIRIKTRDRGGWRTWNEDEITQFEAVYPSGRGSGSRLRCCSIQVSAAVMSSAWAASTSRAAS
jgi:hypothetical protein